MDDDAYARAWAEQQRIVERCRHPAGGFAPVQLERPEHLLAHLERQASALDSRLALTKAGARVSYRQLNEAANRLGRLVLAQLGEEPEPVALLLDNGPVAVAAMLAAWKAGKFFVVLDPAAPPDRLRAILDDSGARLLVADCVHAGQARAAVAATSTALVETDAAEGLSAANLGLDPAPGALACLVYTSGTTGRPKGVMVDYACLAQRVLVAATRSRTGRHDRECIVRSIAFIGDTGVVFNALVSGASVHFFDVRTSGLGGLRVFLLDEEITILSPGVTLFRQFAATLPDGDGFPLLRLIRLAGEQVRPDDLRLLARHFSSGCVVRIGYSGTETSTITDYFADRATPVEEPTVPCGYPASDVEVLITGADGIELGVNEPGEIVVRGSGLARGYWRQPEETAARFLRDPAGGARRRFRTGDVGRLLPNGMLVVMGRTDAQVKVRGHRVEPAEIEAALLASPAIRAAAVAERRDRRGQPWLTAYVVRGDSGLTTAALRAALAGRLPDYMVPQRVVFVDAIPVTLNGKTDWRALPEPSSARPDLATPWVAPRAPVEALVTSIWQEVLGVDPIGVHDAFFDLGGDSLSAALIVARLQHRVGLDLPVRELLEQAATVEAMAALLVPALLAGRDAEAGAVPIDETGQDPR